MYLTSEQIEIGKRNFWTAVGSLRREFLEQSLKADAIRSHYFGYGKPTGAPVKAGIVGVGNEGCEALIQQSSPNYLQFRAYHDIRPTQIERVRKYFAALYGPKEAERIKFYPKWEEMLADKDLEAIVIATPLWTHARFAIEAMKAGKHVLCEKLIARYIGDAKEMVRTADETERLLAVGHQRHYSTLYDNALFLVRSGVLGEIRHVRALWHRNNTFPAVDGDGLHDSWSPPTPEKDRAVDYAKYGYKKLEHLIRWRLYDYTGGGLMAELGSHQLDACSLFLSAKEKVHPKAVAAIGGKYFFDDDRECEDHVYCTYEMPGGVVLTYSSINTNALDGYGEVITGTKGTLMVLNEADVMLFRERERGDTQPAEDSYIQIEVGKDKRPKLVPGRSEANPTEAALAQYALERASQIMVQRPDGTQRAMVDRGYRGEIEAFAHAIRNPGAPLRCDGRVALADAVMALTANVAMRLPRREAAENRIVFRDSWYDPKSDDVPDGAIGKLLAIGRL